MEKIKKKILILGGTGFIGSHLLKKCSNLGWDVTCASLSLPTKNKRVKKVKYCKVDLTNYYSVKKKLRTPFNYVVNLAGYINHSNSKKDYKKIMKEHFYSVKNLIKIIPRGNLERFVQIGSSDEYGLEKAPQSEKIRLSPRSSYSLAKARTAKFLKKIYQKEKYPYAIARLFLTYGPGQGKNRFIPQIIYGCLRDKKFPTTSGKQIRDFCYIDDTVSAIILILTRKKAIGEVFNVATGIPVKIKKINNLINKIVGKGEPDFNKRKLRTGENEILYADVKKIKKKLNWKAKTKLFKGIKKTINSYK